jgi:nucleoid-associated protein YgaU
MTTLEWAAQGIVFLLLLAALPLAWRLERRIGTLRSQAPALQAGATSLTEATSAAEAALQRLRATAEGTGRAVAEGVARGEALRDDLRYLTERAEALADRLDALVAAARPLAGAAGAEAPAAPRSEAERELLRALREVR